MSFEPILSLLESPVSYIYTPVYRDPFQSTPEDIERIKFYSTIPFRVGNEQQAEWNFMTRGLSREHINSLETRGLTLRLTKPVEGSVEWHRVVVGIGKEEYDEMDREGLLGWEESYRMNKERARIFQEAFLALSFDEQVTCARWYKNAAAWEFFESLLAEEDKQTIYQEVEYLDHRDDEMDRREHEWDD
jgi:hypothetical protein